MTDQPQQVRIVVRDHLFLSELRPSDVHALTDHLNDRDIHDNTLRIPYPYTDEEGERFIAFVAETTARRGHPVHFAIRGTDDRLIGACGFDELVHGHRAEIGYWLAKPFWNRGITTDVVRAACGFAFDQWRLVRITAHVFESNRASTRVLEKCGFTCEGTLSKHHLKDGRFLDSKLYALVR